MSLSKSASVKMLEITEVDKAKWLQTVHGKEEWTYFLGLQNYHI